MNRKRLTITALIVLSLGAVIGVYAGTVGVNNLFGFTNGYGFTDLNSTNINAGTEFYRRGINFTQFIELLIPNHDQDVNTTDAVTFASVNGTVGYFMGAVNVTPVLQYPQQEASYIIWVDAGVYYEKNTESGEVIGYGTSAAAIQHAVDNTDGLIVIRNGDYVVSTTIELDDDTYITGEGWRTVLVVGNAGMTAIFDGATAPNYYDRISISNMKLDGNNDTGKQVMGLRLTRCRNVLVDRIYFIDFGNNAVDLTTPKDQVISSIIQNCKFEDIFNYAITFDTGASGTVVQNNIIDNATYGVRLYQGWFHKVNNNHFINCDRGLDVDQSNNSIIYANTFSNIALTDLRVVSLGPPCVNITVTDNIFSGLIELGVNDYLALTMNNNRGGIRENINATNILVTGDINASLVWAGNVFINTTQIEDYIYSTIVSPYLRTPVIELGDAFPTEPLAAQMFYLTTNNTMYYFNTSDWVSMSGSIGGETPGGNASGILYYHADFDEGDLTDVTSNGGELQTQGSGTAVAATNAISYSGAWADNHSTPIGQGSYSRAESIRWRYSDGVHQLLQLTEWYYGMAFYLSNPFVVAGGTWSIIMQSHSSTISDSDFHWALHVMANGSLALASKIGNGSIPFGSTIWIDTGHAIELGQWHTVILYTNATEAGQVKIWLDNVVEGAPDGTINDDFRTMKDGAWFTDEPGTVIHAGMYFGQSEANAGKKWVTVDELRVADTFSRSIPVP